MKHLCLDFNFQERNICGTPHELGYETIILLEKDVAFVARKAAVFVHPCWSIEVYPKINNALHLCRWLSGNMLGKI